MFALSVGRILAISDESVIQNVRTAAVFFIVVLILWLARSIHFKFGALEATVQKAEKQLNGRGEKDTTVSADVAEIRALVEVQARQMTDVHANIIVGDGQREGLRRAMASHGAIVEQMSLKILATDVRVEALEQRNTADAHEAVVALEARVLVVEQKLDEAS